MAEDRCARCGAPLPAGARFCASCGTPADVPAADERRVVTLLFVDVASSTELAASLDPERLREVMAAFYRAVADQVVGLRGRVESFAGDAVLGVFGLPHAHDDDALRAVRAALAIARGAEPLGMSLGLERPLRVRVGVNTGPVALAAGPNDRGIVLGAEVHLAARLQEAAAPGEVLVSATTQALTAHAVSYGPPREVRAKGFPGSVPAWPAVALAPGTSRRTIPLVGRRQEVHLLLDAFERVAGRSRTHLVTLLGEPGIGKSRIVEEFLARLPGGVRLLTGRADPFEEAAPFGAVAHMLACELGLDVEGEAVGRLREALAARLPAEEVEATVGRLGLALGMGRRPDLDHRAVVGELRAGLSAFLRGLAAEGPVVLVLEDAHLAQPELLELVEGLVREARRLPLLVVCVARWELLEARPSWAGGLADAVTLWVEPLEPDDAAELALRAGEGLDRGVAERIARHAGGNPLFIVEVTGMLLHEGRTEVEGALPPTVQAVVASRLDHLSPAARDLARRASIFPGAAFHVSELSLVAERGEEVLRELEDEEILVRDADRAGTWRFRSDVLRAVAYESLSKRERRRLHLAVAEGLAAEGGTRHPRAIAYHLEQAARASLDLDPMDRALADRAVDALVGAGDLARRRIESQAAVDLYGRALALAGPEASWGRREAWILSGIGEARYWLGEFEAAQAALQRALELGGDDPWVEAHASRFLADVQLTARGDPVRAGPLFDRALLAARRLGEPFTLARTLLMAAWAPYWTGELARCRELFEEALATARANPEGDPWAEARALVGLAAAVSLDGDEEEALASAREALAIGLARDDAFTTAVARERAGNSLRRLLRLDEALEETTAAQRGFRDLGARWELASATGDRGATLRLAGRLEEAEADLREALRLCRELGERSLVSWTASELALVLLARGDPEGARRAVHDPAARAGAAEPGAAVSLLRAEAALALVRGDRGWALARAVEALELSRRQAQPNPLAAQVVWVAELFGAEAAGGEEAVAEARARLEAAHWRHAFREPGFVAALVD
ncbi:MAG TPA: AAA family ATPase [Actinomycetota bacterium]|nr:AAA family ATPase [Actinomycetota bacterium]